MSRPSRRAPPAIESEPNLRNSQCNGTERPIAVITGASSGIGAAFARALAARGCDLVLIARRRERLAALAEELSRAHGAAVEVLAADLSREEDVDRVAQRIAAEPRLELLVNNAGFGLLGDFHETPIERQMDMHRVHVLAVVRLTHAALGGLRERDRGGVINVSSVAGFARMPGHAAYAATKEWMIAFSECLDLELRSSGSRVLVQALCPGYTITEFHDVLGLDRKAIMKNPKFWMPAEFVVGDSLKALDRGQWLVIPGWRYRMIVRLLTSVPRSLLRPIVIRIARKRQAAAIKTGHDGRVAD